MSATNPNPKQSAFGAIAKRLFYVIAAGALLLAGLWVWTSVIEQKVKNEIVAAINEQVKVPVEVNGGIEWSLLRNFPDVSIVFKQVRIQDPIRPGKDLLRVDEFSFLCNVFSLFRSPVVFTKIVLRNGQLNLYQNTKGTVNWDIFRAQDDTTPSTAINIKKAIGRNITLAYQNDGQLLNTTTVLPNWTLEGNFTEQSFEVDTRTQLVIKNVSYKDSRWLVQKTVDLSGKLQVNKAEKKYTITGMKLGIDKTEFNVNGYWQFKNAFTDLDIVMVNNGEDLRKLLGLLPEQYKKSLANAEGSGKYGLKISAKGKVGKDVLPTITANAELKDGELKLGTFNKTLKNVNAIATYQLSSKGEQQIDIQNFNCTLNDMPFNFKLALRGSEDPAFDFFANGVLHLQEIQPLVADSIMEGMEGMVSFSNFRLKGHKSDFYNLTGSGLTGSGQFSFQDVEFRQAGVTYGNINGSLFYNSDIITARDFTLHFLSTDMLFNGQVSNLFPYVYNLTAFKRSNNMVLQLQGSLNMNTLHVTNLVNVYDKKKPGAVTGQSKVRIEDVLNMEGNLKIQLDKLVYNAMQFHQVEGNISLAPGTIHINNVTAGSMGGEVLANGTLRFTTDQQLKMILDLRLDRMDIPQIFRECENFGQTTLTANHLKGTLNASVRFKGDWLQYKTLDENSLYAVVDFTIRNGELNRFEPLKAASKFIKVEELESIRFEELSNTIRLTDKRIEIPEFEVKTSALNLIMYGTHHLNNTVDYHLKINLHKLLAQKFQRKNQRDVQYIEEDPYQGLNLYLNLTGPVDNLKIIYDKPSVRSKIKEDLRKQREELKTVFKTKPAQEIDNTDKKREERYFDTREQPAFIDFEEDK